jgi:hypothetical protein
MITITREHGGMVADCDLFATQDGRLVEADDPAANSLVARKGMPIPRKPGGELGDRTDENRAREGSGRRGTPVRLGCRPAEDEEKKADAPTTQVLSRDSIKHVSTGRKD